MSTGGSALHQGPGAGALNSVCVFCGSAGGSDARFVESARDTGTLLAQRGLALVYGGGHIGMMGALADAALAGGGRVTGVIPRQLMRPEVAHLGLTELIVVDSMHQRKRLMADRADAFLVLPGGYGTMDETFEMVTWLQLGLQSKPVVLINVAGFFDPLLRWIRHAVDCDFVRPAHAQLLRPEPTPQAALERLQAASNAA
ncbi:MAG TPA: TIGR00730 family Rossman fold protein [Burkholderiaceae bacterium]|nr:TIGR00730 family Rossman fold protein [Burkholderiaceae bacterium]